MNKKVIGVLVLVLMIGVGWGGWVWTAPFRVAFGYMGALKANNPSKARSFGSTVEFVTQSKTFSVEGLSSFLQKYPDLVGYKSFSFTGVKKGKDKDYDWYLIDVKITGMNGKRYIVRIGEIKFGGKWGVNYFGINPLDKLGL